MKTQIYRPYALFRIKRTSFVENQANFGAGIAFNNFNHNSSILIDSCDFNTNITSGGFSRGGGILLQNFGDFPQTSFNIDISNNLLTNNISDQGGGIEIYGDTDSILVNISNNTFEGNSAAGLGGGLSIINDNFGTSEVILDGNTFINNQTNFAGGGIALQGTENTLIQNSRFSLHNSEVDGSVLAIQDESKVRLENVLMNDNGGSSAIINTDSLWLVNTTLTENNTAINLSSGAYLSLQNTILSSEDGNLVEMGDNNTVVSQGGNLSSDSTLVNYLTGFETYSDFNGQSPDLDMNFAPNLTSVCVDIGNPNGVMNAFDLDGNDRIQGGQIDMGAFESPFNVSTSELEILSFDVSPNPFHNYLQIDLKEIDISNTQIEIIDAMGRIVYRKKATSQSMTISQLNNFSPGAYLLKVTTLDKFYSQIIIKQ